MKFRSVIATATGAMMLAALTAACDGAAADPSPPAAKPTVVLVHGAFADSSSWNGVIEQLETNGYSVIAVANPLRGLRTDAQYVRGLLDNVEGPVLLAGHSYGGSVMSEAADLYITQDEFRRVFAADVPAQVAALMAATQRPITAAALDEPATRAAWKTIPSWNMVTTQDLAIPAESMRFMGERANSQTVEVEASHAVTVSQPGAVADLITTAADPSTH